MIYGWVEPLGEIGWTAYADLPDEFKLSVWMPNGELLTVKRKNFELISDDSGPGIWQAAIDSYKVLDQMPTNQKSECGWGCYKEKRKSSKPFLTAADLVMLRKMKVGL